VTSSSEAVPFSLSFRAIASWIPVSMMISVSDICPSSTKAFDFGVRVTPMSRAVICAGGGIEGIDFEFR